MLHIYQRPVMFILYFFIPKDPIMILVEKFIHDYLNITEPAKNILVIHSTSKTTQMKCKIHDKLKLSSTGMISLISFVIS